MGASDISFRGLPDWRKPPLIWKQYVYILLFICSVLILFVAEPRPSSSSSQASTHSQSLPSRHPRRINSNLSSNSSHPTSPATPPTSSSPTYHSPPPPVPRIPSMYNNIGAGDSEAPLSRGRPRDISIPAAVPSRDISLPVPDNAERSTTHSNPPKYRTLSKKNANSRGRT